LETLSDVDAFFMLAFVSYFLFTLFVPSLDLEGRSDDKIRIMEAVEELRTKRADKQVFDVSITN
jgi:hypothetical protein